MFTLRVNMENIPKPIANWVNVAVKKDVVDAYDWADSCGVKRKGRNINVTVTCVRGATSGGGKSNLAKMATIGSLRQAHPNVVVA